MCSVCWRGKGDALYVALCEERFGGGTQCAGDAGDCALYPRAVRDDTLSAIGTGGCEELAPCWRW